MTPEAALQHWLEAASRRGKCPMVARIRGDAWQGGGTDRDLFRCVSLVSRKLGKAPLALDAAALAVAENRAARAGTPRLDGRPGRTHPACC
jgi:hypothetical protein